MVEAEAAVGTGQGLEEAGERYEARGGEFEGVGDIDLLLVQVLELVIFVQPFKHAIHRRHRIIIKRILSFVLLPILLNVRPKLLGLARNHDQPSFLQLP